MCRHRLLVLLHNSGFCNGCSSKVCMHFLMQIGSNNRLKFNGSYRYGSGTLVFWSKVQGFFFRPCELDESRKLCTVCSVHHVRDLSKKQRGLRYNYKGGEGKFYYCVARSAILVSPSWQKRKSAKKPWAMVRSLLLITWWVCHCLASYGNLGSWYTVCVYSRAQKQKTENERGFKNKGQ